MSPAPTHAPLLNDHDRLALQTEAETRPDRVIVTDSGRGRFEQLLFNGRHIAFHFGFDYFGCVTWYKPTFEVEYAEHSPGLLLTRHLIDDGLRRSRRELDFTGGDEGEIQQAVRSR